MVLAVMIGGFAILICMAGKKEEAARKEAFAKAEKNHRHQNWIIPPHKHCYDTDLSIVLYSSDRRKIAINCTMPGCKSWISFTGK